VYYQALCHAWYYGSGRIEPAVLTEGLLGAVCKENKDDLEKLRSYFKTVSKEKSKAGDLWNEYIKTANQLR
jgi:hypothetical protein